MELNPPWIPKDNYVLGSQKLYTDLQLHGRSVPLIPALVKGYLYFKSMNCTLYGNELYPSKAAHFREGFEWSMT